MTHKHYFGTAPEVKVIPWIGIFVYDMKSSKYRVFSKQITNPIIDSCSPELMGLDVGEHMIRDKYLGMKFTDMDRWHYINWCFSYANHTKMKQQQKRKLIVAVQVSDTEQEVNEFLEHWLKQISSDMDLSKCTYGHKKYA